MHIGGTTATTIGWKENFNMSFNDWVPAHYFARSYYRKIKNLFSVKFYLGGHSKGGNLAFAVALNLKESDLSHIARIDCFDGPGFHNQERLKNRFLKLKGKIHKYIPQGSLIGILQDDLIGKKIIVLLWQLLEIVCSSMICLLGMLSMINLQP